MGLFDSRFFRLFGRPGSVEVAQLAQQVDDLKLTLASAIQDIVVLKTLLQEKGVWDETRYIQLRREQMIADHNSAGPEPWAWYSSYPYTLDEEAFLRHQFKAGEAEVAAFREEVEFVSQLT
jgi:hypothetical protein